MSVDIEDLSSLMEQIQQKLSNAGITDILMTPELTKIAIIAGLAQGPLTDEDLSHYIDKFTIEVNSTLEISNPNKPPNDELNSLLQELSHLVATTPTQSPGPTKT